MTDRHMNKAREIIDAINRDEVSATPAIATALVEAEREGMRRAAEIAKAVIFDARTGEIDNDLRSVGNELEYRILAEIGGSDAG